VAKRQHDTEATRDALQSAGAELFSRLGFEGATVEKIARRARTNKAMISYHFGGKKQLYQSILLEGFAAARAELKDVGDSSLPADLRLREFIRVFGELAQHRPYLPVMMVREAISGGPHLDQKIFPSMVAVLGLVRDLVEQGVREGTFRPVDPLLVHFGIIGSMMFFFTTEPLRRRILAERFPGGETIDPQEFVRHVQDWMTQGLARRPSDSKSRS